MSAGDGLLVVGAPYICRVCGTESVLYVKPTETDGALQLTENHRVASKWCESCAQERTHVLAYALSDYQPDDADDGAGGDTDR